MNLNYISIIDRLKMKTTSYILFLEMNSRHQKNSAGLPARRVFTRLTHDRRETIERITPEIQSNHVPAEQLASAPRRVKHGSSEALLEKQNKI